MIAVIRELEKQPITLGVLRRALPMAKCIPYDDLPRGNFASVVGKKKALVVLYTLHDRTGASADGVGHYSCVLPLGKGKFEYFSSYGYRPEEEMHLTHSKDKLLQILGKNFIRSSAKLPVSLKHVRSVVCRPLSFERSAAAGFREEILWKNHFVET